jgi:hypothetical protein
MQDRRNAPLAQERQIVSVEVMAYEHLARTRHGPECFHQSTVAAADRIGGDNIRPAASAFRAKAPVA